MIQHLLDALEKSIRTWDELHQFVGGQLKMDKNTWYLIEWDFDANDTPYIKEQNQPLNFLDDKGGKILFKQLHPNEPATYLGVTSQVNGSQEAQYRELLAKAEQSARNLSPHTCLTIIHMYIITVQSSQE